MPPAPIRAAEALRALARLLGIAQDTIGTDTVAAFERDASAALGLTQALRFFSDPYAAALVRAFLDVEDPGRPPRHRQHLLRHRRQLQCAEGSRGSPRLMLIVILRPSARSGRRSYWSADRGRCASSLAHFGGSARMSAPGRAALNDGKEGDHG